MEKGIPVVTNSMHTPSSKDPDSRNRVSVPRESRRAKSGKSGNQTPTYKTLTFRSSLFSLLCVVALTLLGGHLTIRAITPRLLGEESKRISVHVREEFMEGVVDSVWADPMSADSRAFFERFGRFIQEVEPVVKIKIWDRTRKIVWSTDKGIIGVAVPEENVQRALEGSLVSNWDDIGHSRLERVEFRNFLILETHIPLWRDRARKEGPADLVLELYLNQHQYLDFLDGVLKYIWGITGVVGIAVFLIMLGSVRLSGRRLVQVARRNQELYLESARTADRLAITGEIAKAVGSTLEPEELFRVIVREIQREVPCNRCIIASIDTGSGTYHVWRMESDVDLKAPPHEYGTRVWWGQKVYRENQPEVVDDLRKIDHPWAGKLAEVGLRSQLVVPILQDDRCIAHITLSSVREGAFSSQDVALLTLIATHLGPAIRNATLFRSAEERAARLAILNRLNQKITENLTLSEVLENIAKAVVELLKGDCSQIYLLDESSSSLALNASTCLVESNCFRPLSVEMGVSVIGKVAQTVEPAIAASLQDDLQDEDSELRDFVREFDFHSSIAVPLQQRGKSIGVINCYSRSPAYFKTSDLEFLEPLASQASIAIENARLHDQLRSMAIIEERNRLGREMHDGLAQNLGFLHMKFNQLEKYFEDGEAARAAAEIKEMKNVTRETYEEVRQSIFGLRSMSTRSEGLIPRLTEYIGHYERQSGIGVGLDVEDEKAASFDLRIETQLIRIIQEALTNVWKHSEARRAWVTFQCQDGCANITIKDDGGGFDSDSKPSSGLSFGLETMRERAEEVGGVLSIHSVPGGGTTVQIRLPLDA